MQFGSCVLCSTSAFSGAQVEDLDLEGSLEGASHTGPGEAVNPKISPNPRAVQPSQSIQRERTKNIRAALPLQGVKILC